MGWLAVEVLSAVLEGRATTRAELQRLLACEPVGGATLAPPPRNRKD
jgi:hypothetical protein